MLLCLIVIRGLYLWPTLNNAKMLFFCILPNPKSYGFLMNPWRFKNLLSFWRSLFCNFLPVFCFGFPGACLLALFRRTKLFTFICSDSSRSPKAIFVWLPGGGNVFPLAMGPRHACPETPLFFWLGCVAGYQAVLPRRGSFAFDVLPSSFAVFP